MKTARKVLLLVLCAALLVSASVMGTLAYLTDNDSATNTFTVGKVGISLDETDVDIMGVQDGNTRVKANTYKLLPGHEYIKDPIVHVDENSENAWVRLQVTITKATAANVALDDVDGIILLENYVNDEDYAAYWEYKGATPNAADDTITYEFWYKTVVTANTDLQPLFTKIVMPDDLDNADIANLNGVEINVVAHAIQADGFENDAAAAWTAFDAE